MNTIIYAESQADLNLGKELGVKEVLLSCKDLAKFSHNDFKDLKILTMSAKEEGLRCILLWDKIVRDHDIDAFHDLLKENNLYLDDFDGIRIHDFGVALYLKKNFSHLKIQFIAETGHKNLYGVLAIRDYLGKNLDRLILSLEISKENYARYSKELNCPLELMILGPIPIYYSNRPLLSRLGLDEKTYHANSEESAHSNFIVTQSKNETVMFGHKDLCLLSYMDEIKNMGVEFGRLDWRFLKENEKKDLVSYLINLKNKKEIFSKEEFLKIYPRKIMHGYYHVNKSDVLFKKLKTQFPKDKVAIARITTVEKEGGYSILALNETVKDFKLGKNYEVITPLGKKVKCYFDEAFDFFGKKIEKSELEAGAFISIPQSKGLVVGSRVYHFEE